MLVGELRRQLRGVKDELKTSRERCSALDAELKQRDRRLVGKCDELQLIQTQVALLHISVY